MWSMLDRMVWPESAAAGSASRASRTRLNVNSSSMFTINFEQMSPTAWNWEETRDPSPWQPTWWRWWGHWTGIGEGVGDGQHDGAGEAVGVGTVWRAPIAVEIFQQYVFKSKIGKEIWLAIPWLAKIPFNQSQFSCYNIQNVVESPSKKLTFPSGLYRQNDAFLNSSNVYVAIALGS